LVTSIVVDPGRDRQGLLFEILEVISVRHKCNLNSIHSRPDLRGGFVFHLDLEGGANEKKISDCLKDLERYCSQFTGRTAEISVFGSHKQTPFTSSKLKSVGIIGGCGVMGRWFADFFSNAGLKVLISDIAKSKECVSIEELCKNSEVILISTPMSAVNDVIDAIIPNLSPGQLVVENCSIKAAGLPKLLAECPDGVEVLGIHTMFAADIKELRGQNVILTKTERSRELSLAFEELIYKHGAITSSVDSKQHDQAAAILQALMQASLVSLGDFLSDNFDSVEELETFSTPNSRAVVKTVQRVLKQNKQLLKDLQELNPESSAARLAFLQTIFKIITALENKEFDKFEESADKARRFFKV
jgi:prephenate dehydrogenase